MGIRILLADDHTIVLQGLSRFLREQADMEVVGQAKDGLTTVELARKLAPDVVIMDISMPGLSGIEATRQIHEERSDTRIIGLSMHAAKRYVQEMYKAGACGYLLKDCDFEELITAIHTVAAGGTYFAGEFAAVTAGLSGPAESPAKSE
jgi:two-component system response regulator NreC